MAEKNPLLKNNKNNSLSDQTSISSGTSEQLGYHTPNHPPAEILAFKSPINSRQKHEGSNRSRTTDNIRRIPRSRSPNSSRSRTDKIASYNLEYRGKIPLASKFFFVFLSFGISLTVIAMISSAYLTLEHSDNHCKSHSEISNIVLPLVIYIMNVVECALFYLEARTFQMRGYTQLFQDASKLSKINFRFISMYYVGALAVYGYLLHHEDFFPDKHKHDRDDIFLGIWYFAYFFIIACLFNFGKKFYVHNREQPKPDLFFPHPNNQNFIQNSPLLRGSKQDITHNVLMGDDPQLQTEVIQKLSKDKSTLLRQLDAMKKKYDRVNRELQQFQNDNMSSILGGGGGGGALTGNIAIKSDVSDLKKQIQKLRSKLRSEREQIKTLSTGIETKKTMLEAQKSETQQLRNVLHAKDDRIQELMNDKEALERGINACSDQKDDLSLQCQVKDQEVEIAKKENERLRKKLQQMSLQNNQNY